MTYKSLPQDLQRYVRHAVYSGHSLLWYAPEENKQSNIRKERSS